MFSAGSCVVSNGGFRADDEAFQPSVEVGLSEEYFFTDADIGGKCFSWNVALIKIGIGYPAIRRCFLC